MTIDLDAAAKRLFLHNTADYADPALAELAWTDPQIRDFWHKQAAIALGADHA